MSHSSETFVGEPFNVSLIPGIENFYAQQGNITCFHRYFSCLTVPKNFIGDPFCVSENSWDRNILWIRGMYHEFLSKIFLSHSNDKLRCGTLLCFRESRESKKVMQKWEGGIRILRRNIFYFILPKKFVGDRSLSDKSSGIEKLFASRGYHNFQSGGWHCFLQTFFVSHSSEIFVGEPFNVSLISVIENFHAQQGNITCFHRYFSCLTVPKKLRWGSLLCFRKLLGSKQFLDEGYITNFCRKFFFSQNQTIS